MDGIPALLHRIAAALVLLDAAALLDCMAGDLAGTLTEMAPDYVTMTHEILGGLAPADADLLCQLIRLRGCWSVTEAADAVGLSRIRMASRVRDFLEQGLVRPATPDGTTRFQVLQIVRQLGVDPVTAGKTG